VDFGLCPMGSLEIEDDDIGEVLAVLIFTAENEELVALPQIRGMAYTLYKQSRMCGTSSKRTHPYARYVSVIVYQVPLPGL
jgi:hypothetical protein